ncbi:MAG: metalloregulator ArsR/SmtB family transcription factor [Alphaproteobacteria bacterium]|nr:metalloregulator ArsR/SmtB family transcription factor [Alphaproteobacteria bacterium]
MERDRLLAGLRAAAEPTRLRLLTLCAQGELTVAELTQILGQSQPRLSRHLRLLCEAGLLLRAQEGTHAFFRLARGGVAGELVQMLLDRLPTGDAVIANDLRRLGVVRQQRAVAADAYFRLNALDWDRLRALHIDESEVEHALASLLPVGRVRCLLDIGTGTGRMLQLLAGSADELVGLDSSRDMLAVARARLDRDGLRNCSLRLGDMYRLPWDDGTFDAAVLHMVLHYAGEPEAAIAEAARVLAPGGRLVVADFAPHALEELRENHAHRRLGFPDGEVEGWCRDAGLVPRETRHLPGEPLTVTIWMSEPRAMPAGRRRRTSAGAIVKELI